MSSFLKIIVDNIVEDCTSDLGLECLIIVSFTFNTLFNIILVRQEQAGMCQESEMYHGEGRHTWQHLGGINT